MKPRRVVILGSTGSIGESALKVARDIPDRMQVVGLAANKNWETVLNQAREFRPLALAMTDPSARAELSASGLKGVPVFEGEGGLCELATLPDADMVLVAIVGTAGLRPALAAIEAGKDIAVASKEILVMAGEAVMAAARRKGVAVLPVDSEHNAIFQCLDGRQRERGERSTSNVQRSTFDEENARREESSDFEVERWKLNVERFPSCHIRRLILTASGGPFRTWPAEKLADVTPEQALKHPTWNMGAKITIDSATLFNKGLEMIEARWLFDVEMRRVEVIVHPQSIVHSMVEFIDSSVLAQLSTTDMCFPIQYAVTWPDRVPNRLPPLDFAKLAKLEFEAPRVKDFPALDLARLAGEIGGTMPAVLNAANEVAVARFLKCRCSFPAIWQTVAKVMHEHRSTAPADLPAILDADRWARARAAELL